MKEWCEGGVQWARGEGEGQQASMRDQRRDQGTIETPSRHQQGLIKSMINGVISRDLGDVAVAVAVERLRRLPGERELVRGALRDGEVVRRVGAHLRAQPDLEGDLVPAIRSNQKQSEAQPYLEGDLVPLGSGHSAVIGGNRRSSVAIGRDLRGGLSLVLDEARALGDGVGAFAAVAQALDDLEMEIALRRGSRGIGRVGRTQIG